MILGEGNYEFENLRGYPGGTTESYLLRETAYWTLTSGGIGGYLYGNQHTWRSTWTSDPATLLDTPGATQIAHINTLFNKMDGGTFYRPEPRSCYFWLWYVHDRRFGPKTQHLLLNVSVSGSAAGADLLSCTHHSHCGDLHFFRRSYCSLVRPQQRDVHNDWWEIDSQNSGSHDFTMPGNNADGDPDWVLLLQAAGPTAL